MNAKDKALANIIKAQAALAELPRSRVASLAATKLDEACLWLDMLPAEKIEYTTTGHVSTASADYGALRIEIVDELAECSLRVPNSAPIEFLVRKPHDRDLLAEARDLLAALYWSRARMLSGHEPGKVTTRVQPARA